MSYHYVVPVVYSCTNSAAKIKIKYDAEWSFSVLKSKGDSPITLTVKTSQKLQS